MNIIVKDVSGEIFAGGFGRVKNREYSKKDGRLYDKLVPLANDPGMPQVYFKGEEVEEIKKIEPKKEVNK